MHCSLVTVFKVIHSLTDNEVLKHIQIKVLQIIIFIFKLSVPSVNSTLKGPNSLTYGAAIWNSLLVCLENVKTIPEFKVNIKIENF